MDDIDRRIVACLQDDASRPLKTLAAEVGLSRSSVRERIARLQSCGVIRRYTVEVAAPVDTLVAILRVKLGRTPDPVVVAAVVGCPEVFRCRSLSGDIDLLVEIAGATIAEINRVRDHIANLGGVAAVETSFVLNHDKSVAG